MRYDFNSTQQYISSKGFVVRLEFTVLSFRVFIRCSIVDWFSRCLELTTPSLLDGHTLHMWMSCIADQSATTTVPFTRGKQIVSLYFEFSLHRERSFKVVLGLTFHRSFIVSVKIIISHLPQQEICLTIADLSSIEYVVCKLKCK